MSSIGTLETIAFEAKHPANGVIVWLPGLEQSAHHIKHLAEEPGLQSFTHVKHIFVHTPKGYFMPHDKVLRRWIDFELKDGKFSYKKALMEDGIAAVQEIIHSEMDRGIDPEHIFLAGFSQGSIIAYFAAVSIQRNIGGIIYLSGLSPKMFDLHIEVEQPNKLPVLVCHGTRDKVFSLEQGKSVAEDLRQRGHDVMFREYAMGHEICDQQINDIANWLAVHFDRSGILKKQSLLQ